MSLAIIVPCYQESENIKKLIDSILLVVKNPKIIIVDDSPDNSTEKIVKNLNNVIYIYRGKKLGRGSAVLHGMRNVMADNEIDKIIEMDADLSHDPEEIKENIKKFENENLDLLISSRYLEKSKIINWSLKRKVFSFLSNKLAKFTLKVPITDYTNGFRIYSRRSIEQIITNCGKIGDGFIILSEILVELHFNEFKIGETHSIFRNRVRGTSSVTLSEILNAFFGLFKILAKKKIIIKNKKVN
tara:strand:- start:1515 stop:2243 length:729 start_codon:yes stop_codon:yes gene_type:complete